MFPTCSHSYSHCVIYFRSIYREIEIYKNSATPRRNFIVLFYPRKWFVYTFNSTKFPRINICTPLKKNSSRIEKHCSFFKFLYFRRIVLRATRIAKILYSQFSKLYLIYLCLFCFSFKTMKFNTTFWILQERILKYSNTRPDQRLVRVLIESFFLPLARLISREKFNTSCKKMPAWKIVPILWPIRCCRHLRKITCKGDGVGVVIHR